MNIHDTETIEEFEKLVKLPEMEAPEALQEVYRAADGIAAATFILLAPIPEGPFSPLREGGTGQRRLRFVQKNLRRPGETCPGKKELPIKNTGRSQ